MSRFYPQYTQPYDEAVVKAICGIEGIEPLTARALIRRGIVTPDQAMAFLNPAEQPLYNPLLLPDMPEAVVRICDAIKSDARICVYGDYDADGICATAILVRTLERMGGRVIRYIPSRHDEGYGLNEAAVRILALQHVNLLITVDNGIGAHDEIALCRNLGIDVIVTDHHSIGATLPKCCAVISAKRKDSAYPENELCGAGVALKLAQALLPEADHSFDLALAAVATVADVVPLMGENRTIVARGLTQVINVPGLRALLLAAGWKDDQPVTEQTLAFLIAPRLNASGRMHDAMRGVELLLSEDSATAGPIAAELDADNTARKTAEAQILAQACEGLDIEKRALLLQHEGWNPGVTGIVASRLCERYHRPVILFTEQNGLLTGSGRSPEGIHLFEVLSGLSRYFVRFGGHARAAGVTMEKRNFAPFCEAFDSAMQRYDAASFVPTHGYEETLTLEQLSVSAVEQLQRLAPFGEGNPEPTYCVERVALQNVAQMGKEGAHLSACAVQNGVGMRLVAFRQGALLDALDPDERYDCIARPGVNRFRDRVSVELYWVAINIAQGERKVFDAIFEQAVYNSCGMNDKIAEWYFSERKTKTGFYTPDEMRRQYVVWCNRVNGAPSPGQLASTYPAKQLIALLVFLELGFFALDAASGGVKRRVNVQTTSLDNSALYRLLTARAQRPNQYC